MGPLLAATKRLEERGHRVTGWDEHDDGTASACCRLCGRGASVVLENPAMLGGPALAAPCPGRRGPHPQAEESAGALSEER